MTKAQKVIQTWPDLSYLAYMKNLTGKGLYHYLRFLKIFHNRLLQREVREISGQLLPLGALAESLKFLTSEK